MDKKRLTAENGRPIADKEYGEMLANALGIDLAEALTAEDPAHPSWDKRK